MLSYARRKVLTRAAIILEMRQICYAIIDAIMVSLSVRMWEYDIPCFLPVATGVVTAVVGAVEVGVVAGVCVVDEQQVWLNKASQIFVSQFYRWLH